MRLTKPMRFPSLQIIVQYGLYTVKELERFSKGLVSKRAVVILDECSVCAFVFDSGGSCPNCYNKTQH
jgi:hypothetical protein